MRNEAEVEDIYGIILMAAFAIYILLDYLSHERNVYKLLFLLPIGMSTLFLTEIPSHWTTAFLIFFRIMLIVVCVVVVSLYFNDVLKRKKKRQQMITARQRAQQKELRPQSSKQNQKKKKKH